MHANQLAKISNVGLYWRKPMAGPGFVLRIEY